MLIPCCWWCGCVPPFTDSTPDQAVGHCFGGGLWVWLGGTLLLLWFRTCESGLGTLLGPEKTFACAGVFLVRLLAGFPNALLWVWWCWWLGVWLCVECCIVDASILLWSSV